MCFKNEIIEKILDLGFSDAKILSNWNENDSDSNSLIIASFPYSTSKGEKGNGVRISPFAQSNHYGEAVKRLKKVAIYIREKKLLKKRDIQIFCNSRLEEKRFAASCGLGFYGRNSLIITEKYGSRVILAGIIVPFKLENDQKINSGTIPGAKCGNCTLCIKKCPTSAIGSHGEIDRNKCLQSLSTDKRILPEKIMGKWGNRLYGCQICQSCCPFNKSDIVEDKSIKGYIGDSVPYRFILESNDQGLKSFFKDSTLGMSWIEYDLLRRNTIISAANEGRKDLIELIEKHLHNLDIAYAVKWALDKLKNDF